MKYTEREVLQFIEENNVKFVKLMFCDIHGKLKTVSIISKDLGKIFSNGLALDTTKFDGFIDVNEQGLKLFPDPDTLALLPWRSRQGRVVQFFCNIKKHDGTPYEGDGRQFLINAVKYARSKNYPFMTGTSCDFYVFETDGNDMQTEDFKLHKKSEEIRTINRAKLALMQYLGFTEQQAHHYLEKQAMDLRCAKIEIALKIIKLYEI